MTQTLPPGPSVRTFRKLREAALPVTDRSIALFRLGEMCNNHCPMCSNSGREEAFFVETEELLRRVEFLARHGMRRVVLTGGEATIHPGFWDVVAALGAHEIVWDINTHGRSFADRAFADRARAEGLERAIVSLHARDPAASALISGTTERGHHETVAGIRHLLDTGVWVMVNIVLSTVNAGDLADYVDWAVEAFGTGWILKVVFPSTLGKGGDWEPIHLRYRDVVEPLRAARERATAHGLNVVFESFPSCVLGDPTARDVGRSGFGETHYLDDVTGDRLYPIRYIESRLSVYADRCAGCRAVRTCGGVGDDYAERFGLDELVPFR